jgi:hypothetical protein
MKQIKITAAAWAVLMAAAGIVDGDDDATVEEAIGNLAEKANKHDTVSAELRTVKGELTTLKTTAMKAEVTGLLDAAVTGKKITVEVRAQLAEDYATNPGSLKKMLDKMPAYQAISDQLTDGEVPKEFADKSWDELHKADKTAKLKELAPAYYAKLYEEKFGVKPVM